MNDISIEWFTPVGESTGHKVVKFLFLILAIAMLVVTVAYLSLIPLIIAGGLFALFIIFYLYGYVEYSFILIDDDLRIAIVYNRNRRRLKWQFSLSKVDRMVNRIEEHLEPTYLCRPDDGQEHYTMVVNLTEERTAFVMEAPEEFLNVMRRRRLLD